MGEWCVEHGDRLKVGAAAPMPLRPLTHLLLAMMAFAAVGPFTRLAMGGNGLSIFFFVKQDLWVMVMLFIALKHIAPDKAPYSRRPLLAGWSEHPFFMAFLVPMMLLLTGWAGRYWLFQGYDLSRDEQMVTFDAWIFSHGRLFWPLTSEWRPFAQALNTTFILPMGQYESWVSAYLPVNAVLHAMIGAVSHAALTNPVLLAVSFIALWRISLRVMPGKDARNARLVTFLMFVNSGQVIFTAMTTYAMTGHLAFNLVWLLLFLRDRPASHAMAICIGFLATGLHQPLFHPLFVAPFLWLLFEQKRWRLLTVYGIAYCTIAIFWFSWPVWLASHASHYVAVQGPTATSFFGRLMMALRELGPKTPYLMDVNLLRFAAWQHLLLIPLGVTGAIVSWRTSPIARALTIGFILPVVAMTFLLAYQGHGWGYRYVHGLIGNACLLAGMGWMALERSRQSYRKALMATTAATVLIVFPFHAWAIHRHVAPYAEISREIDASGADIALIDTAAAPFGADLVLNRPDLGKSPIRLDMAELKPQDVQALCTGQRAIMFVGEKALRPIRGTFSVADFPVDQKYALPAECPALVKAGR